MLHRRLRGSPCAALAGRRTQDVSWARSGTPESIFLMAHSTVGTHPEPGRPSTFSSSTDGLKYGSGPEVF